MRIAKVQRQTLRIRIAALVVLPEMKAITTVNNISRPVVVILKHQIE